MKSKKYCFVIILLISTFSTIDSSNLEKSLSDLYKSGSVRFVPILTIDDSSTPEDMFFENVSDIKSDTNGFLYICDYGANNIIKFDKTGNYLKTIGRKGQEPGEFNRPYKIAVTADRLIVLDQGNRRICALSLEGEFIKSSHYSIGEIYRKILALPNGDIAFEVEKLNYGDLNKTPEYLIEIYSSDLEKKKTVYSQQIWRYKLKMKQGMAYKSHQYRISG